jgi:hypothetical protein
MIDSQGKTDNDMFKHLQHVLEDWQPETRPANLAA